MKIKAPNSLNWLFSTVLTPHSALADIIEHFCISFLVEQTCIPEKQQELGVHGHHHPCYGKVPSGQTVCPEATPGIRPAAFTVGRSLSSSPGPRDGPAAGGRLSKLLEDWARLRVAVQIGSPPAVESGVCEHACSQNTPRNHGFKRREG